MKLAAIAKLIKADGYCKLYKVFYDDCRTYGWYECPVCGYRTDWEPHACPICHTLLEP